MTTACVSLTTVYSVNTPALANWNAFSPPTVNGRGSLPDRVAAVRRLAAVAGVALAAVAEGGEHDVVADLDLGDGASRPLRRRPRPRGRARPASGTGWCRRAPTRRCGTGRRCGCGPCTSCGSRVADLDVVAHLELAGPDDAPLTIDALRRVRAQDLAREGRRRAAARRRSRSARR